MTHQQLNNGVQGSATRQESVTELRQLEVALPVRVYRKWLRVQWKLEAEAGRPLGKTECLRALLGSALDSDGNW